jgi:hypothetical protein
MTSSSLSADRKRNNGTTRRPDEESERESVFSSDNPTYKNLLEWSVRLPLLPRNFGSPRLIGPIRRNPEELRAKRSLRSKVVCTILYIFY